jgi:hypothetical protein
MKPLSIALTISLVFAGLLAGAAATHAQLYDNSTAMGLNAASAT